MVANGCFRSVELNSAVKLGAGQGFLVKFAWRGSSRILDGCFQILKV